MLTPPHCAAATLVMAQLSFNRLLQIAVVLLRL